MRNRFLYVESMRYAGIQSNSEAGKRVATTSGVKQLRRRRGSAREPIKLPDRIRAASAARIPVGRGGAVDPLGAFDDLDRKIVTALQFDGRRSYASIARKLRISEGTVRARVNQLRRAKLLRFIAVIDPIQFGNMSWGMLGITATAGTSPHELARYFAGRHEVTYVMMVAARYDLLVEVQFEKTSELNEFLEIHCHGSGKVASVETMVGLKLYKWLSPVPGD